MLVSIGINSNEYITQLVNDLLKILRLPWVGVISSDVMGYGDLYFYIRQMILKLFDINSLWPPVSSHMSSLILLPQL